LTKNNTNFSKWYKISSKWNNFFSPTIHTCS